MEICNLVRLGLHRVSEGSFKGMLVFLERLREGCSALAFSVPAGDNFLTGMHMWSPTDCFGDVLSIS
jgi:hypothetical protein